MMRGVLLYEIIFIIWYYSYISQIFHCDTGWRNDEGCAIVWTYFYYLVLLLH